MFHYTPHYITSDMLPYTYVDSPLGYDPAYDMYDARRSRLEQIALARRQQERRAAEEAAWVQQQRRRAAIQAAIEEQQALEEERQRRHEQQLMLRQRRARELEQLARERQAAAEEEHRRRKIAQYQQQQEQVERQRQRQLAQHATQQETDLHPLESLLRAFFGQGSEPDANKADTKVASSEPQSQQQPQSESQEAVESAPAPAPTPNEESAAEVTHEDPVEQSLADPVDADYESSAAEEDAASTLQRHYRTHLHRRQALSTLSSLSESLKAQQTTFTMPEKLTFQPSPPSSIQDGVDAPAAPATTPRLAFSPSNAPLLAYEDFLVRLLSKIDAVSSGGDRTIKRARKDLVKAVNDELARLDAARDKAWSEQQQQQHVAASEATNEDARMADEALSTKPNESETQESTIEPVSHETPTIQADEQTADNAPQPAVTAESEHNDADADDEQQQEDEDEGHDSDSTLSVDSVEVNAAIDDIVRQARKLGERVDQLEKAELRNEESEQFVMV